jgi:predicted DNA binding protein
MRRNDGTPRIEERETLRAALEMDYSAVSRATTLVGVADELGRSDARVSQRRRRGMGDVLCETDVRGFEES